MACGNVDMDIHGDNEDPHRAGWREPLRIQQYQASEFVPEKEGPLHNLLQKQPAVLGELLYSLMAMGTKEFLSLLVELDWDSSRPLNTLLCLVKVLCRGWSPLSSVDSSLSRVLLSATVTRECSSVPTTEPALLTSLSSQPASLFLLLPPQQTTA
ncbi:uncharacterized protein si:ch211-269k10.4 isoform X3 [Dicentrarchus labrax]|uniref:uncharacterized protein si:ch211-269k10.4 isoform X3 n=1 Tax=Dicentrarchus labrax TaxID=13489 RepID=UPI0021F5085A|nr:uncharacterized protein si:ch211-269k10.4 isoform X3 [Dicentrarchus labrax]